MLIKNTQLESDSQCLCQCRCPDPSVKSVQDLAALALIVYEENCDAIPRLLQDFDSTHNGNPFRLRKGNDVFSSSSPIRPLFCWRMEVCDSPLSIPPCFFGMKPMAPFCLAQIDCTGKLWATFSKVRENDMYFGDRFWVKTLRPDTWSSEFFHDSCNILLQNFCDECWVFLGWKIPHKREAVKIELQCI